jgi:hypothetical protein
MRSFESRGFTGSSKTPHASDFARRFLIQIRETGAAMPSTLPVSAATSLGVEPSPSDILLGFTSFRLETGFHGLPGGCVPEKSNRTSRLQNATSFCGPKPSFFRNLEAAGCVLTPE